MSESNPAQPDGEPVNHVANYEPSEHPPSRDVQMVAFDPRWLRRALLLVFAVIIGWQLVEWSWQALTGFLFLLLLAWILAISFEPVVKVLEKRRMKRGLATGLVIIALIAVSVAFIGIFGGILVSQASTLVTQMPQLITNIVEWINSTFNTTYDPAKILEQLQITPARIQEYAGWLAGGLFGFLSTITEFIFAALTVVVFSFYLSADAPRIKRTVASWLPPRQQLVFVNVWEIAVAKAGGFVVSKVLLSALSAAAHTIVFWIIDIPFWLPMGIFAGVVGQFIPTIGTYIGIIVPCLFAFFVDPWDVVWIVAFATVYQQIENYVLTPKISKKTMDVHAGVALAAVFIGAAFFGPIGAIIGIPLVATLIAVVEAYGQRYEIHPELIAEGKRLGLAVTADEITTAQRLADEEGQGRSPSDS